MIQGIDKDKTLVQLFRGDGTTQGDPLLLSQFHCNAIAISPKVDLCVATESDFSGLEYGRFDPNGGLAIYHAESREVIQFANWSFDLEGSLVGSVGTVAEGITSIDYGPRNTSSYSRGLFGVGCTFEDFHTGDNVHADHQQLFSPGRANTGSSEVAKQEFNCKR